MWNKRERERGWEALVNWNLAIGNYLVIGAWLFSG
jgi:hypothetical protein